jgi:hypothetical protein
LANLNHLIFHPSQPYLCLDQHFLIVNHPKKELPSCWSDNIIISNPTPHTHSREPHNKYVAHQLKDNLWLCFVLTPSSSRSFSLRNRLHEIGVNFFIYYHAHSTELCHRRELQLASAIAIKSNKMIILSSSATNFLSQCKCMQEKLHMLRCRPKRYLWDGACCLSHCRLCLFERENLFFI